MLVRTSSDFRPGTKAGSYAVFGKELVNWSLLLVAMQINFLSALPMRLFVYFVWFKILVFAVALALHFLVFVL